MNTYEPVYSYFTEPGARRHWFVPYRLVWSDWVNLWMDDEYYYDVWF